MKMQCKQTSGVLQDTDVVFMVADETLQFMARARWFWWSEQNATSGFDSRLNPWSCVVRPLTTAGSAKMSLGQRFTWLKLHHCFFLSSRTGTVPRRLQALKCFFFTLTTCGVPWEHLFGGRPTPMWDDQAVGEV